MVHWQLRHKDDARKWYDQAIEWTDKNAKDNRKLHPFRTEATQLLGLKETPLPKMQQDDKQPKAK